MYVCVYFLAEEVKNGRRLEEEEVGGETFLIIPELT